jgi:hypothetical protein
MKIGCSACKFGVFLTYQCHGQVGQTGEDVQGKLLEDGKVLTVLLQALSMGYWV